MVEADDIILPVSRAPIDTVLERYWSITTLSMDYLTANDMRNRLRSYPNLLLPHRITLTPVNLLRRQRRRVELESVRLSLLEHDRHD